jgi:hypothetical protein
MPSPINVRVRGIYSTALNALLLAQGYTIVDPSPAIQKRLHIPSPAAPKTSVSLTVGIGRGRCVTGVEHVLNRQEFRQFISQSIHTCDTPSCR